MGKYLRARFVQPNMESILTQFHLHCNLQISVGKWRLFLQPGRVKLLDMYAGSSNIQSCGVINTDRSNHLSEADPASDMAQEQI